MDTYEQCRLLLLVLCLGMTTCSESSNNIFVSMLNGNDAGLVYYADYTPASDRFTGDPLSRVGAVHSLNESLRGDTVVMSGSRCPWCKAPKHPNSDECPRNVPNPRDYDAHVRKEDMKFGAWFYASAHLTALASTPPIGTAPITFHLNLYGVPKYSNVCSGACRGYFDTLPQEGFQHEMRYCADFGFNTPGQARQYATQDCMVWLPVLGAFLVGGDYGTGKQALRYNDSTVGRAMYGDLHERHGQLSSDGIWVAKVAVFEVPTLDHLAALHHTPTHPTPRSSTQQEYTFDTTRYDALHGFLLSTGGVILFLILVVVGPDLLVFGNHFVIAFLSHIQYEGQTPLIPNLSDPLLVPGSTTRSVTWILPF
jgi:hypothetical protein